MSLKDKKIRTLNQALFPYNKDGRKYKGKKPYKITKGKYCKYCKLPSHDAKDCYFLFPDQRHQNRGIRLIIQPIKSLITLRK